MAQPSSRQELIDYCKRKLGAPVLEINVADEQIEDLVDDAVQFFQERHFDGVYPTFLKYKITDDDINRGRARPTDGVGISTITVDNNVGLTTQFNFYENGNYPIYYGMEKSAVMGMGGDSVVAPAPAVSPGENKITSNVSITYEIR